MQDAEITALFPHFFLTERPQIISDPYDVAPVRPNVVFIRPLPGGPAPFSGLPPPKGPAALSARPAFTRPRARFVRPPPAGPAPYSGLPPPTGPRGSASCGASHAKPTVMHTRDALAWPTLPSSCASPVGPSRSNTYASLPESTAISTPFTGGFIGMERERRKWIRSEKERRNIQMMKRNAEKKPPFDPWLFSGGQLLTRSTW